jgi:hypothetical protein
MNLVSLAQAVLPLLSGAGGDGGGAGAGEGGAAGAAEGESAASAWAQEALRSIVEDEFPALLQREVAQMRRSKLGLGLHPEESAVAEGGDGDGGSEEASEGGALKALWEPLPALLMGLDYTIFWRQLSYLITSVGVGDSDSGSGSGSGGCSLTDAELVAAMAPAVYPTAHLPTAGETAAAAAAAAQKEARLCAWLRTWMQCVADEAHRQAARSARDDPAADCDPADCLLARQHSMQAASPK